MSTGSSKATEAVLAPGQERKKAAPRPADQIPKKSPLSNLQMLDQQALRRKTIVVAVLLVAVCLFNLCVDRYNGELVTPDVVLGTWALFFQQLDLGHTGNVLTPDQVLDVNKHYYSLLNQTAVTAITAICGMLLALAGTLYQNVFRNPIASPTMLGVSNGVQVGVLVLVVLFGANAVNMPLARYLLSYGFIILTLAALFFFSKMISGPGRPLNVINMLLVGTIISQLYGVITTYVTWNVFTDELWEVYNSLSEAIAVDTEWYAFAFLLVMAVISVTPIVLLRFRLNVLSFPESDMKGLGVSANRLQVVALTCATLMMVAAQVSVGTVAMISLVVPHVSRFLFGAEFRKQFIGNVLLGALVLMVCRCVGPFIPYVGGILPIGTLVSFVVMPAFAWMIATQQRTWE
ncbi:MAG: iron chelate uptake ABC transporter family permease subunit [Coriobacteriia bacterium]|nr:iron chelate uptake ABC transporter family permease subunit [Coriobacteriia bacterium]